MYSINEYVCISEGLDKNTCDKIRNSAKGKWKKSKVNIKKDITEEERITGAKPIYNIDKKYRICDVVWTEEQWIYDLIKPYMFTANEQAGWKYDIRAAENMQITRYKKGGFYNFHKDGKGDHLSVYKAPCDKALLGFVRKLSMTVLLNDDYVGGEFQFARYKQEKCRIDTVELNKTGSIIIFPSDIEHRVTPITNGTRYSLVIWFLGPPFI